MSSPRKTRRGMFAAIGSAFALIATLGAGVTAAADDQSAPEEMAIAESVQGESPAEIEEAADPGAATETEAPADEEASVDNGEDDLFWSNPDNLSGPETDNLVVNIDHNIYPEMDFGGAQPMMRSMARSANGDPVIGSDHPVNPGDVMLFKQAEPVDGMVNTWDVTLRIEGKNKQVTSDIVLVIDRSGSMNNNNRMPQAKTAAKNFVSTLLGPNSENRDTTRIGVVSFAGDYNVDSPLTRDTVGLNAAINGLNANGGTFTQAGIKQAEAMLENSTADFKHIVLLSDGEPTYSYAMANPRDYATNLYYDGLVRKRYETTTAVPESAFTSTRTGNGGSLRTQFDSEWGVRYYDYNHGNSAIAQSGFAKDRGVRVWSIGLEMNATGEEIMESTASPNSFYTATPDQLETVFGQIAGNIAAAVKDAAVGDPMGQGFEIPVANVSGISATPSNPAPTYADEAITWNPGTLTTPLPNPGSDPGLEGIKYAELRYRISINDKILDVDPTQSDGLYLTNGDASLTYKDTDGDVQTVSFPMPKVKPTLYTLEKVLKNANGDAVTDSTETFTVNVTGPGGTTGENTIREYVLNPGQKKVITDLRYTGTYTVEETGDLSEYSVDYSQNEFTVPQNPVEHFNVVVTNRPAVGTLAISKMLAEDADDAAEGLEYTGTYTCELDGAITASGSWSVTGEGEALLKPADDSAAADMIPVNSVCTVTEDTPTGLPGAFYTWKTPVVGADVTITKDATSTVDVTNDVTTNPGSVTWTKVDSEGEDVLGGSEWNLTGPTYPEGETVVDCVSESADNCTGLDKDPAAGKFKVEGLNWGEYTLVETLAPAGYMTDPAEHTFTIGYVDESSTLTVGLGNIENTKVTPPSIPLTGGIGRDAFLFAGLGVLGLGLAVSGTSVVRRRA